VVWSAHDELLHREVAVKRIPLAPEEDAERASREALATARLAHPAIVALYEACAVEDAFYLISELIDGQTLARLIAEDALSDEQALRIGVALCSALAHAHSRGVVHRDVKPQNVLVPHSGDPGAPLGEALGGVAKLTDFGGARMSGQDVLTQTGDVLGTLAYMAPEQSEGHEVGEQSDLYSLALVLYEALCGVNPVRGATPAQTVRLVGRSVPSLARSRRDLPRLLTGAIDRALATSPARRGTVQELRLALEQALEQAAPQARRERRSRRVEPTLAQPPVQSYPRRRSTPRHELAHPLPGETTAGAPADQQLEQQQTPTRAAGPALPRVLWLAGAVAAGIWQTLAGRPGVALLLLVAVLPIALAPVPRRSRARSGGWLVASLAPALGIVGLAGAFPAVAGQAARWRMRAALGALGYWWLTLAEPLLSRRLWLGVHPGTPGRTVWEGSLQSATTHTIAPLLSLPVLLGATLWAAAAAVLPLLVRGRSAPLDVLAATVWSAALAAAAPLAGSGLSAHTALASPRGAILGAVFGGALAVGARALRGPV
jgi:hypothetical protein